MQKKGWSSSKKERSFFHFNLWEDTDYIVSSMSTKCGYDVGIHYFISLHFFSLFAPIARFFLFLRSSLCNRSHTMFPWKIPQRVENKILLRFQSSPHSSLAITQSRNEKPCNSVSNVLLNTKQDISVSWYQIQIKTKIPRIFATLNIIYPVA